MSNIVNEKDYINALEVLYAKGRDGFEDISSLLVTAMGAGGAWLVAPWLATILGAVTTTTTVATPTVLGSATLASWLGVVGAATVTTTPIGWALGGIVVAGGLTAYAVSKVGIRAAKQTMIRVREKENIKNKIISLIAQTPKTSENDKIKLVADALLSAEAQSKIQKEAGVKILSLLESKQMTPEVALNTILKLISGQ